MISRRQRLADDGLVPLADEGLDRKAVRRRGADDGQVAQPGQRHVQRARDGGRGQCEHVDLGAQPLELFLLAHAEAVFLVDDQQTEVFEPYLRLQQFVGADDDVDRAVLQSRQRSVSCCLPVRKRDSSSMRTGQSAKRSRKFW